MAGVLLDAGVVTVEDVQNFGRLDTYAKMMP
jgi:hypothetical protein